MNYDEKVSARRFEVFFNNIKPFFNDYQNGFSSTTSKDVYCKGSLEIEC